MAPARKDRGWMMEKRQGRYVRPVWFMLGGIAVMGVAVVVQLAIGQCNEAPPLERHAEEVLGPCAKWPREEPCPTDSVGTATGFSGTYPAPKNCVNGRCDIVLMCRAEGQDICECAPGTVVQEGGEVKP